MDKSEIVKIIAAIKVQCPEALNYQSKDEFNVLKDMWYDILREYPQEVVWQAVRNALKNTVFQKQNWIGAICQEIEAMKTTCEKTDGDLWTDLTGVLNEVGKIMYFGNRKHWYNGELIEPVEKVAEIYEKIDPILQGYVGGVAGLISLSQSETLEYEKGRFQKALPTLRQREKTRREMSPMLSGLIQSTGGENQKLLK
jgi:hypothetical protein